jgi:hypothetical protein
MAVAVTNVSAGQIGHVVLQELRQSLGKSAIFRWFPSLIKDRKSNRLGAAHGPAGRSLLSARLLFDNPSVAAVRQET